jgi:nucleotide sugar dehydrogenase
MPKTVCVIGVGYVGTHLVQLFSKKFRAIGVDVSETRVQQLQKQFHLTPKLSFQSHFDNLSHCDVFLVSVPTLLDTNKNVDMSYLISVRDTLLNISKPGSLIVIESSVYVGATRQFFQMFLNKGVHVAFSPERVDPGRTKPLPYNIPKIISGLDHDSLLLCKSVYEKVFKTVVPVSSCECAEMCKLYENCFRMVNIAYVNEISDMCNDIGIDVHEMIRASSTKPFGFMPFQPSLGVGGHCIPVNPYYLFTNGTLPVLNYSTKQMEYRPKLKATQLVQKYSHCQSILLVGIGFKPGESLTTNSPGLSLYYELSKLAKDVVVYDPLVQTTQKDKTIPFLHELTHKTIDKFDLVILNHPLHSQYNTILDLYSKMGGHVHSFVS